MNIVLKDHDWSLAYKIESNFRYIISEQEAYGWKIDTVLMDELLDKMFREREEIRLKVLDMAPLRVIDQGQIARPFKKDGSPAVVLERWYNNLDKRFFRLEDIVGTFTRVNFEELNLESPVQRIDVLQRLGWTPTEYNYKTDKNNRPIYDETGKKIKSSPKLTQDSVTECEIGQLMIDYMTLSHRYKLVKGLKERLKPDGSVGSGGITVGCNTGRMMHRGVANIPRVGEYYGKEIRSLFSHRDGYTLIGADLCSLENRLMGHYTYPYDNGEYARRLESEDSHTTTQELVRQAGREISRQTAKTLNYAVGYGAQIGKVAEVLDCDIGFAKTVYELWWEDKASMKELKERIEKSLRYRGMMERKKLSSNAWVKGLDGRRIYVRSAHSLINALIQNAGSIVNKFITCSVYKGIKDNSLNAMFVVNYHDEIALEVEDNPETIEKVKELINQSVTKCNQFFEFKVPMDMDIKVGSSWAKIH